MPRQHLTLTPIRNLTLPEINALVQQLQSHLEVVVQQLAILQGADGNIPVMGNDLDMGGHAIRNVGEIEAASGTTAGGQISVPTSFLIAEPADAPASADALRDDLVATTIPDIQFALNTLAQAVNALGNR